MSNAELFVFRASTTKTEVAPDTLSFITSATRYSNESELPVGTFAVNTDSGAVFNLNTSAAGQAGNGTVTEFHVVSGGKFAAFVSTSSNLVAGDTNGAADVFLRNLETGEVTLVSRSAAGVQADGASGGLDVSADGTKLLFHSTATNLVSGDANGFRDVFVKDLATGTVTLVSTSASGQAGNGDSRDGTFSPDGRSVAFLSNAANLAPNDINGTVDVFLKNLGTGAVTPLSYRDEAGRITGFPVTAKPAFSAEGDSISFGAYSYTSDTDGVLVLDVTRNLPQTQLGAVSVSKGDGTDPVRYVYEYDSTVRGYETSLEARLDYDRDGDFQATVTGLNGTTTVSTQTFTVKVRAHAGSQTFTGDGGSEVVVLSSRDDEADGGEGDDVLLGYAGRDDLSGGGGNDRLDGGLGADTLKGGTGDDRYVVDAVGDTIVEAAGAGRDTVEASVSLTLAADVEDLVLVGTGDLSGTGNGLGNAITGNAGRNTLLGLAGDDILSGGAGIDRLEGGNGDDTLDGGAGDDRLIGGAGDDTYLLDSTRDVVEEAAGGGIDTIVARFDAVLGVNIENLTLAEDGLDTPGTSHSGTGNASDNVITGNGRNNVLKGLAGDDVLIGGAGVDILDGGAGADRMVGGEDADTYYVSEAGDQVVETADEGVDTIYTAVDWMLTNDMKVERLSIVPGARIAVTLVGNDLRNTITGGILDDVLDGGVGADVLSGRAGSDTYTVDSADDAIVEAESEAGSDTLIASVNYTLASGVSIETLRLAEGRSAESLDLIGNAFGQTLIGNGGASRLIGRGGDDTYIVDNGADLVFEAEGEGNDTVVTSGSYILGIGQEIETLKLANPAGTVARGLAGNDFANTLIGNAGANGLDGGGGADSLYGLSGNDTYTIDDAGDRVFEKAGEGIDTLRSSVSYVLAAGQSVEILTLTGTASLDLTGNELANTLYDNAGDNRLEGGSGADVLYSRGGIDTLVGGPGGDGAVIDRSGATAALSFVMASVESTTTLVGDGTTTAGIGHITLTGGSGNDRFTTLDGTDVLDGGAGNDTLVGGAGRDTLTGGSGDDTLNGGTEADLLFGGAGDDTYLVDGVSDRVFEAAGGGTDRVFLIGTFYLAADQEVETLQLLAATGTVGHNVAGNAFGQTLVGNAGANALDGKGGMDVLTGGRGADSFVFSTALGTGNIDRITDFAAEDRFLLGKTVFSALAPGQLAESAFKNLDAGAVDGDDRILYRQSTGEVFYDADGSGSGAAVKFAVLDNKAALTAADFVV